VRGCLIDYIEPHSLEALKDLEHGAIAWISMRLLTYLLVIFAGLCRALLTFWLIYGFAVTGSTLIGLWHRCRIFSFLLWILDAAGMSIVQTSRDYLRNFLLVVFGSLFKWNWPTFIVLF
jgi:hypothetical protein